MVGKDVSLSFVAVVALSLSHQAVPLLAGERWTHAAGRKTGSRSSRGWSAAISSRARQSTSSKCGSRIRSIRLRSIASWAGPNRSASTRFACSCTTCRGKTIARRSSKTSTSFSTLSARHKIRPMLVFFDGVWDPDPQSGPQNRPRVGVHNSGWVQSPGRVILADHAKQDALKPYVTDVISRYAKDDRVLAWDLFNEPDNLNGNSYGPLELKNKDEVAARLVRLSFEWARAAGATQPLTVCLWGIPTWDKPETLEPGSSRGSGTERRYFVSRLWQAGVNAERRIHQLRKYDRPLICTEYMARGNGSTFEAILPVAQERKALRHIAGDWWMAKRKPSIRGPPGKCRSSASQILGITISFTRMANPTERVKSS